MTRENMDLRALAYINQHRAPFYLLTFITVVTERAFVFRSDGSG